jgi:hypothetical protein
MFRDGLWFRHLAMRARLLLCSWAVLSGCGDVVGDENAAEAERTVERAKEGVHRGVEVARAQLGRVDWERAGEEIEAGMEQAQSAVEQVLEPAEDADPFADAAQAIHCEGLACTVTADFAGRMRAHPGQLAEQARVRAQQEGGRTIGMRVDQITDGSLPHRFGLRDGDVVTSINRAPLDSVAGSLTLTLQLRSATHFDVEFLRAGEAMTLVIDVV